MLGRRPRGTGPICSNRPLSFITRARMALQATITRIGSYLKVTNWSLANPWSTDE